MTAEEEGFLLGRVRERFSVSRPISSKWRCLGLKTSRWPRRA